MCLCVREVNASIISSWISCFDRQQRRERSSVSRLKLKSRIVKIYSDVISSRHNR
jgi:hypothetical protein